MRIRIALAWGLAACVVASAAGAKDVCVHTTVDGGWTFVLHKVKLKPGRSGAVSGYAVRDDLRAEPISGGYVVFPRSLSLGVTRYLTGLNVESGSGGTTWVTRFHQILTDLDPEGSGSDWWWMKTEDGAIETESGDANVVSCKGVPKLAKE
jgi:hypothetical protein